MTVLVAIFIAFKEPLNERKKNSRPELNIISK